VRLEIGPGADVTNELYFEDTSLTVPRAGSPPATRQLISTPETRWAGVAFAAIQGTRNERATTYLLQNELSLGDKTQRDALSLAWRDDFAPQWRLLVAPSLEWRHDRTFDRDQEEWRGSFRSRVRRSFDDEATSAEAGLGADVIRASGLGSQFLLDRNSGRASLAVDHLPLFGDEWRIGYSLSSRVFPDSAERDHDEHAWEGRWRHPFPGGHSITLETTGERRLTHHIVTTSRDNFWEEFGSLEGEWRAAEGWALRMRLEGEALQYDLEDSTIFFDYRLARARLGVRLEGDSRWTLTVGPRAEVLSSRLAPGEEYREIGGAVEVEVLGSGSWWNVTPAAGWRDYHRDGDAGLTSSLHSSFAFYELEAFVDQPLPARLRLRGLTTLRYEAHTDPTQNAGSLYLSVQLRWAAL
jgi:hypothetical protein